MNSRHQLEWDYIIAGGGTAGCVLASRLTEDPDATVLLLEAGGEYPAILSVPLAGMRWTTQYSWKYFTRQQAGLSHRRLSFPFGKVLGGSSSVNAMMYYRGTAASYQPWGGTGNTVWDFQQLLPYFRKSESAVGVSQPRHRAPLSEAFVEGCLESGMSRVWDFHAPQGEGAGFFQVMQQHGRRSSAASAYLAPVRRRKNLRVRTLAQVCRLILEHGRAIGVEFLDGEGRLQRGRAAREVILCAGTLNSPKILMCSGIGPKAHLESVGIRPLNPLEGVGRNLQDHVRIPVLVESGRRSPGEMIHWIPAALNYALRRKGVLASNCCEAGAVVRTSPDRRFPDLQFVTHFQSAAYPGTVDLQYCLLHTESRGKVTLASSDPLAPPVIDPNYLAEPADMRLALSGLRLARKIAQSPALRKFPLGKEIMPGPDIHSDRELERYVRAVAETCYHPAGTCRMGAGEDAVVDDRLRVHGVQGLRVVDASIMPSLPNGNTCAPTLMIAEKAADLIRNPTS